jgi:glutathione peroxidase-family protein
MFVRFLKKIVFRGGDDITWNFAKFLVKGDGSVDKFYGPKQNPLSFEQDIVALLE